MNEDPTPETPHGVAPPRYRLPPDARPGAVRLQVADLRRSIAYYQDVLGLRVLEREAEEATLGAYDDPTPLLRLRERKGAAPIPYRERLGLYHFALLVPDRPSLATFLSHLTTLGVRVGASYHTVSEALYLYDPDGIGIEVYADTPREGWKRDGGQFVMRTVPLDREDLLREAEDPWTGMPGGTVMGHVHLHVGDLQRAEAFYREALGLEKTVWSYEGVLFFAAGSYHHHLGVNTWADADRGPDPGDARLLEWEMILPGAEEVAAAARSVAAAGFPGVVRGDDRLVTDPWGTVLRLRAQAPHLPRHSIPTRSERPGAG